MTFCFRRSVVMLIVALVAGRVFAHDPCRQLGGGGPDDGARNAAWVQARSDMPRLLGSDQYALAEIREPRIGDAQACLVWSVTTSLQHGVFTVALACTSGNVQMRAVHFRVCERKQVAVASRILRMGERIESASWQREERWVPMRDDWQMPPAGSVIQRRIERGAVIDPEMLQPEIDIKRGQKITAISNAGLASVELPAVARSDARVGEPVWIRTVSGQVVRAFVVAPGVVRMEARKTS